MTELVLQAKGLVRRYQMGSSSLDVLRGVDLDLGAGETLAIIGRSGSGKSTLLHLLGLLDRPDEGRLSVGGRATADLSRSARAQVRNRHVGFVFQFYHLFAELSALENVLLPCMISHGVFAWRGRRTALRARATELLVELGLGERLKHRPNQLSGGERQRVAIARALVAEPSVLLCDEPTGNLDERTSESIADLLLDLAARRNQSLVLVTHDTELAARAGPLPGPSRGTPRAQRGAGSVSGLRAAAAALLVGVAACAERLPAEPDGLAGALAGQDCVVILLDALRADHLGSYGAEPSPTPRLDALAEGGVRMARATAQASWTLPSTASLFTGLYQETHGLFFGIGVEPLLLVEEAATLADLFSEAGYATHAWSQNTFASDAYGLDQGFDEYTMVNFWAHDGDDMADQISALLAEPAERPRFVYAHFRRPHTPYDPPGGFPRESPVDDPGGDPFIQAHNTEQRKTVAELKRHHALYRAGLTLADAHVGRLLDALDLERTLVVLLSDHGEAFDEHGKLGHNWLSFQEYVHIPWLMSHPRLGAGRVVHADQRDAALGRHVDQARQLVAVGGVHRAGAQSEVVTIDGHVASADVEDPADDRRAVESRSPVLPQDVRLALGQHANALEDRHALLSACCTRTRSGTAAALRPFDQLPPELERLFVDRGRRVRHPPSAEARARVPAGCRGCTAQPPCQSLPRVVTTRCRLFS